jgi:hypothetical protein
MRLPFRSAAINSRSFHGLSSASDGLPLCEEFVYLSLALEMSQKRIGPVLPCDFRKEGLVMNSLQFLREMPAIPPSSSPQSKVKPSVFT